MYDFIHLYAYYVLYAHVFPGMMYSLLDPKGYISSRFVGVSCIVVPCFMARSSRKESSSSINLQGKVWHDLFLPCVLCFNPRLKPMQKKP